MKQFQVSYSPWHEDQEMGQEAARLFVRAEGLFFVKSALSQADLARLVLKEADEKALFQSLRRRSFRLFLIFLSLFAAFVLLAYTQASLQLLFLGVAALVAAAYAVWHYRRAWSGQLAQRVLGTQRAAEGEETRYLVANGACLWDIRAHGLARYPLALLRVCDEDERYFYLGVKGSSYYLICDKGGFIKGEADDFRSFCQKSIQSAAAVRADAGGLFGETSEFAPPGIPFFEHEQVLDLGRGGLRMIQKRDGFRSGEDAVCLAHFASQAGSRLGARRALPGGEYADFTFAEIGCGGGMISLLLSDLIVDAQGWMLELVPRQAALAGRNVRLNHLENRLTALNCDVRICAQDEDRAVPGRLRGQMDLVVVNPPYRPLPLPHGLADDPLQLEKQVARFCLTLNCRDLARAAVGLLREDGYCCLLYPLLREEELLQAMREEHLSLARKRLIVPRQGKEAEQALYAFIYSRTLEGAAALYPDLVLRDEQGAHTDEAKSYYAAARQLQEADLQEGLREPTAEELAAEEALAAALRRLPLAESGEPL